MIASFFLFGFVLLFFFFLLAGYYPDSRKLLSLTRCMHSFLRPHAPPSLARYETHAQVQTPFCMHGFCFCDETTPLIFSRIFSVIHYVGARFDTQLYGPCLSTAKSEKRTTCLFREQQRNRGKVSLIEIPVVMEGKH